MSQIFRMTCALISAYLATKEGPFCPTFWSCTQRLPELTGNESALSVPTVMALSNVFTVKMSVQKWENKEKFSLFSQDFYDIFNSLP